MVARMAAMGDGLEPAAYASTSPWQTMDWPLAGAMKFTLNSTVRMSAPGGASVSAAKPDEPVYGLNPRFGTGEIFAMTEPLNIYGDLVWVKLGGDETGGRCAIMEIRTAPRSGPPLHRHNNEDEWFYVLEGEYLFEVDGARMQASAGSSLLARRGTAHAFENTGTAPGRLLVVSEPAGLDEFFRDLAGAAAGGNAPDPALVAPVFHKHGLELLGPPLAG